jgi:hypothetical protein
VLIKSAIGALEKFQQFTKKLFINKDYKQRFRLPLFEELIEELVEALLDFGTIADLEAGFATHR